jgi:UDP-3-O-[3-hydroxymyristoyl] glucosamine N-acyltransferase
MNVEDSVVTAGSLAERLGGELDGDASHVVRGVAPLDEAGPDALSWIGDSKYLPLAERSEAGVILVPLDCDLSLGCTLIRVADPDLAICLALEMLAPHVQAVSAGVHPSATVGFGASVEGAAIGAGAYVGDGASIGAGTQIHPGVHVGARTAVGRDCVLWPNVVVRERIVIGDRVVIHSNTTIGADGFGYLQRKGKHVKIPQIGSVVIEDDVEIGANCAIDRARSGVTRIGTGTKIDNLVQIAHNVQVGAHCIIIAQCALAGSSKLGMGVMIAGHSGVAEHKTVGDGARIAAKTTVMKNVSPGEVVRGIPAVDNRQFLRQQAAVRKLPEWAVQLRELKKRVAELESRLPESPDSES